MYWGGNLKLLGYPPAYALISLIAGLFGILNIFKFSSTDLNYFIRCLAVVLILQFTFAIPDVFNRVLPFELRTKKGFTVFVSVITVIYCVIIVFISGNLNAVNLDWSFENIIQKVITYGIVMLMIILFYRLSKNMNRKQ